MRISTWLLVGWSALMGLWATSAVITGTQADRSTASLVFAVVVVFFVWLVGFVPLSIVWFMTKPKGAADELARLQAARDGGILTDEEYRAKAAALSARRP